MQSRVQKWGNSLGIRVPKSLAQKVGLTEGTPIELEMEEGFLIVRPRYSLEMLLSGVTPENLHREVDTGKPVGREVL